MGTGRKGTHEEDPDALPHGGQRHIGHRDCNSASCVSSQFVGLTQEPPDASVAS